VSVGTRVRAVCARLLGLATRESDELRMHEEMRFHLDRLAERYMKEGIAADEARRRAALAFGGMSVNVEAAREELRAGWADRLSQDTRFALRMFRRTPLLTTAAIATLALGAGATISLFGVLDAITLRSVDAPRPNQLFALVRQGPQGRSESLPYPLYAVLASERRALGSVAGYAFREVAQPAWQDTATVQLTSSNWFGTVGIAPRIGRAWAAGETEAAVVSDRFARRHFGAAEGALGRSISLGDRVVPVMGVMPPSFRGLSLDYRPDVWVPIELQPAIDGRSHLDDSGLNWVRTITRLTAPEEFAAAAAAANLVLARQRPALAAPSDTAARLAVVPAAHPSLHDAKEVNRAIYLATGLAAMVLLIACANIANLQVARGAARRAELAARCALGAARRRLVQQLLTENLLLAAASSAAGLGVASALTPFLESRLASRLGAGSALAFIHPFDSSTLCFTVMLCLGVWMVFGIAPAFTATRLSPVDVLKQSPGPRIAGSPGRGRRVLLGVQVSASVVLLVTAGVLLRGLQELEHLDLGYSAANLVQVSVDWGNADDAATRATAEAIGERLRSVPGIVSVSTSMPAAFGRPTISTSGFQLEGEPRPSVLFVRLQEISPGFFETTGLRIVRGRGFTAADRAGAPHVAIVNETAARQIFHGTPALGKRFARFVTPDVEVVGVVRDARISSVIDPPPPVVYVPMAQVPVDPNPELSTVELRLGAHAPRLAAIARMAATASGGRGVTVDRVTDAVRQELELRAIRSWVTGALGLTGLVLAMIGVYGLNAYLVTRRTGELGIRLALGASPRDVLWLMWRQGMRPVAFGAGAGLVLAFAAGRAARATVEGLGAPDLGISAGVIVVLLVMAGIACYVPARRAARVDPALTLRVQ
jgi:predicted permease